MKCIESKSINLDEGEYHKGKADVIRFVGVKNLIDEESFIYYIFLASIR